MKCECGFVFRKRKQTNHDTNVVLEKKRLSARVQHLSTFIIIVFVTSFVITILYTIVLKIYKSIS